jgi:hypothetical protein
MHCRNCSSEISEQAIACPKCGVPPSKGNKFCYQCGYETNPQAIICVNCGVSLQPKSFNVSNFFQTTESTKQPSLWAAILILIGFFLPWIDFSVVKFSAWELRDIVRYIQLFEDEKYKPSFLVNLMYLLPIISILIIATFFSQNIFLQKKLRTWKILAGVYPLLFLIMIMTNNGSFVLAYGFYLTLICGLYLLYDGIFLNNKKFLPFVDSQILDNATQKEEPRYIPNFIPTTPSQSFPETSSNPALKYIIGSVILILVITIIYLFATRTTPTPNTSQIQSAESVNNQSIASSTAPEINPTTRRHDEPVTVTVDTTTNAENVVEENVATDRIPTDNNYPEYTIITDKSYLFERADLATKKEQFLTQGDVIKLIRTDGPFAYVIWQNNQTALVSNNWVLLKTLKEGKSSE